MDHSRSRLRQFEPTRAFTPLTHPGIRTRPPGDEPASERLSSPSTISTMLLISRRVFGALSSALLIRLLTMEV